MTPLGINCFVVLSQIMFQIYFYRTTTVHSLRTSCSVQHQQSPFGLLSQSHQHQHIPFAVTNKEASTLHETQFLLVPMLLVFHSFTPEPHPLLSQRRCSQSFNENARLSSSSSLSSTRPAQETETVEGAETWQFALLSKSCRKQLHGVCRASQSR